ncbi:SWIM zinc finger family protein [Microvirga sp. W0021]|uniref:SWIM zinc finger family protein n=1 Tax=Hohaiivirga grylli TaxID=3133970 RepID=A0ABV0BM37_9HYPH
MIEKMSLKFQVMGSSQKPYNITVEGSGENLRAFCSCPAGRKGGMFCKHIAAILVGDITNLVEPSDSVRELQDIAQGSPLIDRAIKHKPSNKKPELPSLPNGIQSLATLANYISSLCDESIYHINYSDQLPETEILSIHKRRKNGIPLKSSILELSYELNTYDTYFADDGDLIQVNHRPRVRPWTLRSTPKTSSWSSFEKAGVTLLEVLETEFAN